MSSSDKQAAVQVIRGSVPVVTDAVLALPIAAQCFKVVSRQSGKITDRRSSLHAVKLEARRPVKARKRLYTFPASKVSGPHRFEGLAKFAAPLDHLEGM